MKQGIHPDALEAIAAWWGTPCYVYDGALLKKRAQALLCSLGDAPVAVHFAVKACSNIHILKLLGDLGCGADIVSGGELYRALKAGIPAERIVFSGVGKTESEVKAAVDAGIHSFNVESADEVRLIDKVALACGRKARVSFRFNPDIDAKTHPYISTGLKRNKFGLDRAELKLALGALAKARGLTPLGLSCHIGSQILSLKPLARSWKLLAEEAAHLPFKATHLDLGGGLGVAYNQKEKAPPLEAYGKELRAFARKHPGMTFGIEPGRSLVAEAGQLLTRVVAVKRRGRATFVVVDAGMNDLLRPALYGARHEIRAVSRKGAAKLTAAVVGPVCESADVFSDRVKLPAVEPGDLLAISHAGAYGMSMASRYNSRALPAEILVDGGTPRLIRARESDYDQIRHEIDPKGATHGP